MYEDDKSYPLAVEFICILKNWIGEHLPAVIAENKRRNDDTCATHDYCDSNEAMAEAFKRIYGRDLLLPGDVEGDDELEAQHGKELTLFTNAWNIAQANDFFV